MQHKKTDLIEDILVAAEKVLFHPATRWMSLLHQYFYSRTRKEVSLDAITSWSMTIELYIERENL